MGILQLALEVEEILIRVVLQNIFQEVRHRHEEVVVELLVIKAQQAINDGGWVRHLALAGQRTQNRLGALRQSQNVGADAEEAIRQLVQLRHQTVAASEGVAESVQNLADVRNTDCSKFAFNGLKNPVREEVCIAVRGVIRGLLEQTRDVLLVLWVVQVLDELATPLVYLATLADRNEVTQVAHCVFRGGLGHHIEIGHQPVPGSVDINRCARCPVRVQSHLLEASR